MKRSIRNKSSTNSPLDFDLFSSYSHEQVHIFEKNCSSISSRCELAYCTSEGLVICVPRTCSLPSSTGPTTNSMLITRIVYPSSSNSTKKFFDEIKENFLKNLFRTFLNRPNSLSSFDRFLCSDTIQSKGFRTCLFSPSDVKFNRGRSILAAITSTFELLIYEILSPTKRFYQSDSSILRFDLTEKLFTSTNEWKKLLVDSTRDEDFRFLYFHQTTSIVWNGDGTKLFQLQNSGHLIIWKFDFVDFHFESIVDTKIVRPTSMSFNWQNEILLVIGKENRRVFFDLKIEKLFVDENDENDSMICENSLLIVDARRQLILVETKLNFCFVSQVERDENSIRTRLIDVHRLSNSIVALEKFSSNKILFGCDDGTIFRLNFDEKNSSTPVLFVNGQIKKSSTRKFFLLRHFQISTNFLFLIRIFYSPIVGPNVKFGFVLVEFQRISTENFDEFFQRKNVEFSSSADEFALIYDRFQRGEIYSFPKTKISFDDRQFFQRFVAFFSLLNEFQPVEQLNKIQNDFLQIYRRNFGEILRELFQEKLDDLTPIESLIYSICSTTKNEIISAIFLCPLCDGQMKFSSENLLISHCVSNEHSWPRCSRTLLPLKIDSAQICSLCNRMITSIDEQMTNFLNFQRFQTKQLRNFFSNICTFCLLE